MGNKVINLGGDFREYRGQVLKKITDTRGTSSSVETYGWEARQTILTANHIRLGMERFHTLRELRGRIDHWLDVETVIKGRVGKFEYGYIGSQAWIIRNRETMDQIGTARNLLDASKLAKRAYDATREKNN